MTPGDSPATAPTDAPTTPTDAPVFVFELSGLAALVNVLRDRGHRVLGPVARDGAIVLDELNTAADLPIGWGDEQSPGRYRLRRRGDDARFGFAVGPHSPRRELSPPNVALVTIRRSTDPTGSETFDAQAVEPIADRPIAFVGVRPCEVAAMAVHERVLLDGTHPDPVQAQRSEGRFVVAVDCGDPASTCFCTSMGTGPDLHPDHRRRFDLRLCEIIADPTASSPRPHRFVCWVGSSAGEAVLEEIRGHAPVRPASGEDLAAARLVVETAATRIERRLDTHQLAERLAAVPEHPLWDDVASRCLSCTNCTLVCPTCFCSDVHDVVDLSGELTTRTRVWDSCFSVEHSHLHGGSVHASTRSRYRQWLTHKLSTWWDQFGESGCVGCGRCIAWCPAAIDLVEEANGLSNAALDIGRTP